MSVIGAIRMPGLSICAVLRSQQGMGSRMNKLFAIAGAVLGTALMGSQGASAAGFDLGSLGNYTFVDLGNGTTLGQNSGPVAGNELLGNGVTAHFSGGNNGAITGTLYYDSTVGGTNTFDQLQNKPTTQLVSTSVTQQALSEAQNFAAYAEGLSPTQTFGSITGTTTISSTGSLNVISVDSLSNPKLTISGGADDLFIFNVAGKYSTNQVMTLAGGVTPGHILFNFLGSSGAVFQTSGGDLSYGIYLATHGGQYQFSNLNLTGQLINTGGNVQLVSGSKIPTFVPLPGTVYGASAMLLGLFGFGAYQRRRLAV